MSRYWKPWSRPAASPPRPWPAAPSRRAPGWPPRSPAPKGPLREGERENSSAGRRRARPSLGTPSLRSSRSGSRMRWPKASAMTGTPLLEASGSTAASPGTAAHDQDRTLWWKRTALRTRPPNIGMRRAERWPPAGILRVVQALDGPRKACSQASTASTSTPRRGTARARAAPPGAHQPVLHEHGAQALARARCPSSVTVEESTHSGQGVDRRALPYGGPDVADLVLDEASGVELAGANSWIIFPPPMSNRSPGESAWRRTWPASTRVWRTPGRLPGTTCCAASARRGCCASCPQ